MFLLAAFGRQREAASESNSCSAVRGFFSSQRHTQAMALQGPRGFGRAGQRLRPRSAFVNKKQLHQQCSFFSPVGVGVRPSASSLTLVS